MIAKPQTTMEALRFNYIHYDVDSMSSAEMDVEPVKTELETTTKKSVSFSHAVQCRETLHVNNYTDAELHSCWYTVAKFDEMREEYQPTIRMLKYGQYPGDSDELCARGLECRVKNGALERRNNKMMAWEAVFQEQHFQAHAGIQDDVAIAMAYSAANHHCMIAAYNLGLMDEYATRPVPKAAATPSKRTSDSKEKKRTSPFSRVFGKRNRQ